MAVSSHPYTKLNPHRLLNAVETTGHPCDGRLLALNSYENRVYQVGIEEGPTLVAKFYRPGRWSDAAILEEHAFAQELADHEIPIVAPWADDDGRTLFQHQGFRFTLFPCHGGRGPELDDLDTLAWLGRFLGRIHAVGVVRPFHHRPHLEVARYGEQTVAYLLDQGFIPPELVSQYRQVTDAALAEVHACFERAGPLTYLRVHGDCHPGNVLWTERGPHFVDLDDCLMAPAIQDLWMLLSGDRERMTVQLGTILEAYTTFLPFNPRELHLVEALRTLRLMHYAAWLAQRWHDPAFPASFPWFNTVRYWQEHIADLEQQISLLTQPPLAWG